MSPSSGATNCSRTAWVFSVNHELDVETIDMLTALAHELAATGIALRLADVHTRPLERLRRSGLADRVTISPTLDAAVQV